MNDKQQLLIDCISLLPVIGILVLITVANDQLVTMVAAYVLCGELLCVLVSRILNLYYIDVAFVWLGGIMLWLWYWFWLESSHVVRLCKLNCVMLYSHSISSVGERPAPRGGTTRPDECKITTI